MLQIIINNGEILFLPSATGSEACYPTVANGHLKAHGAACFQNFNGKARSAPCVSTHNGAAANPGKSVGEVGWVWGEWNRVATGQKGTI